MTLYCSVSSAAPAETNVISGFVGNNQYYLDLSTTTAANKKIVNDFLGVIGNHINVDILDYNLDDTFEATIIIPGEADLEIITLEYPSLAAAAKTKVNSFVNLANTLAQNN
jgi:hypothetical protein